jgi:hypothetical protein
MVPPWAKAILDISVKYSFSSSVICSGCRRSVVAVKSLMSEKKIVSLLRSVCMVTSFCPLKMLF